VWSQEPSAAATAPTFNQSVAPILYARCVGCHRPGEAAPMSLTTYEAARPWARAIKAKTLAREMPPWPADRQSAKFRNESALSDEEVATLAAWADAGAPQGSGTPPAAPRFLDGWSSAMNRPPDLVIDAPDFVIPADGLIPEFKVWAKQAFGRDRFIEAVELRPTNRAAVHHASVFRARLPRGAKIGAGEAWPGGPMVDGVPLTKNGARLAETALPSFGTPVVFYVPAGGFLRFPQGVAKRVAGDEYLLWTFHLVTTGKADHAGARVGLWFSKSDVQREVITWTVTDRIVVNGREVPHDARGPQFPNIAPNEGEYTVIGSMRVTEPITLYALWPHMHYRGRDITFSVDDGKGREQMLLSIPHYRFGWQFTYELATPLKIAAGSTIKAVAHYDNSARNRENPDPNEEVIWGPQARNEMFDPFLELTYDRRTIKRPECEESLLTRRDAESGGPGFLSPCN
jgi:hypothetical protein